jgi:ligand-binding SRPBCC domain-containing protein
LLTPPPVRVEIDEPQSIIEGTSLKFVMWFGFTAVRWTALHENVDPHTGFDDIQVEGPFGSWKHKHRFAAITIKSTEIRDEIEAEMGSGWRNSLICRILWLSLPILFAYRTYVTRKTL